MIYLSFALMGKSKRVYAVLATLVCGYWIPNQWQKDERLKRHPNWPEYKQRSWLFVPPLL